MIRASARALLSLLVPPRCLACDEPLDPERGGRVCPECLDAFGQLSFEGIPCCPFCGIPCGPVGRGAGDAPCGPCSAELPPFEARSWGHYEGPLRDAILRLKFGGATALGKPLGALLAHAAGALPQSDALVAVPLHRRRLLERGFNQAAILAHAAAPILELPVLAGALVRTRETGPQTALDRTARAANVRGSFAAEAGQVAGLRILLVDDVFTTGATATAAAAELLSAGALAVSVVTVGRAARHEAFASATM